MLTATDTLPLNFLFTGKGNDSGAVGLEEQVIAGAGGLKLHEASRRFRRVSLLKETTDATR